MEIIERLAQYGFRFKVNLNSVYSLFPGFVATYNVGNNSFKLNCRKNGYPIFKGEGFDLFVETLKIYLVAKRYISLGKFPVDEVLPYVGRNRKEYCGKMINMESKRYNTYLAKGVTCVTCGKRGSYFSLERPVFCKYTTGYHFNLYADDGTMMTVDHIIPKSKGGPDYIENLQPMCSPCNVHKADKLF